MNEHAQQEGDDNVYTINLGEWSNNAALFFTDAQFAVAMKAATILSLNFYNYRLTLENFRGAAFPLCRCIADLRRHNKYHPLLQIEVCGVDLECSGMTGMTGILEIFMVAAKLAGIRALVLSDIRGLPHPTAGGILSRQ